MTIVGRKEVIPIISASVYSPQQPWCFASLHRCWALSDKPVSHVSFWAVQIKCSFFWALCGNEDNWASSSALLLSQRKNNTWVLPPLWACSGCWRWVCQCCFWLHNLHFTLNVLHGACTNSMQAEGKGDVPVVFLQGSEVLAFVFLVEQTLNLWAAGPPPAAPPGHHQQQEGSKPDPANEVWNAHNDTYGPVSFGEPKPWILCLPQGSETGLADRTALQDPRCSMSCYLPCLLCSLVLCRYLPCSLFYPAYVFCQAWAFFFWEGRLGSCPQKACTAPLWILPCCQYFHKLVACMHAAKVNQKLPSVFTALSKRAEKFSCCPLLPAPFMQ